MDTKNKNRNESGYATEVFTGIRPTGNLTVANYLGAVVPVLELQKTMSPLVFIADIHAMTDREPDEIRGNIHEVVADYLALGIDPKKSKIYLQSSLAGEVTYLMSLLARHISVAELLRIPTLKDKLKGNSDPETANALLLLYPVLMAADILLNRSQKVPVGEDQLPHLEATRLLAKRFNKKYGNVLPPPEILKVESLRILSLKGSGKMSKTNPNGAIFLTDPIETVKNKIKKAETAIEGQMNDRLASHIILAKGLAKSEEKKSEIDEVIKDHQDGKQVMGRFKQLLSEVTVEFLKEFQEKRAKILKDPLLVASVLEEGGKIARRNARETLKLVEDAYYN